METMKDLKTALSTTMQSAAPAEHGTFNEPMVSKENVVPKSSADEKGGSADLAAVSGKIAEKAAMKSTGSQHVPPPPPESEAAAHLTTQRTSTPPPPEAPKEPEVITSDGASSKVTSADGKAPEICNVETTGSESTSTAPESTETSNVAASATTSRSESPGAGSSDDTGSNSSSGLNPLAADFRPTGIAKISPPPTASHLYELRPIEGKGLGLVAIALIPQGTCIICETPLIRIDTNKVHLAWGPYCRLPNAQKAAFDALHFFKPENVNFEQASRVYLIDNNDRNLDEDDVEDLINDQVQVMGRFACNNFACGQGLGVFEITSRLNHSCVPNVNHSYNPTMKKQTVFALRDIQPGEELCTTYLGGKASYYVRAQRVEMLRRKYGFTCACPACVDVTGESDGRREVMANIAYGLQVFYQGGQLEQTPFVPDSCIQALRQAEDLIHLLKKEGLQSIELCKAYRMAATQALTIQNFQKAFEYAYLEKETERNCLGTEIDDLIGIGAATTCWISQIRDAAIAAGVPTKRFESGKRPKTDQQKMAKKLRQQKKKAEKAAEKIAEKDKQKRNYEAKKAEKEAKQRAAEEEKTKKEYEAAYPELKG